MNTQRAQIVATAKDKATSLIRAAETDAASVLSAGRQEIAKQIANAHAGAESEAHELAQRLANQVDTQLAQGA